MQYEAPRKYYVAAGVQADYDKLLKKFSETNSVRYEHFSKVWREMNFSFIFAGRNTDAELRQLVEECLRLALAMMMPPYSFQVRVGALYLLYAIFMKQPLEAKMRIRMTIETWMHTMDFLTTLKEQRHLDAEFILQKLRYIQAFQFAQEMKQVSLSLNEVGVRAQENIPELGLLSTAEDMCALGQIFDGDRIDQLSMVHENYHQMKCSLAKANKPAIGLDMLRPDLVQIITKTVASQEETRKKLLNSRVTKKHCEDGATTSESDMDSEPEAGSSGAGISGSQSKLWDSRAEIRNRAFGGDTQEDRKSRRHRRVIQDTKVETPSPSKRTHPTRLPKFGSPREDGFEGRIKQEPGHASYEDTKTPVLNMPFIADMKESPSPKKQKNRARGKRKTSGAAEDNKPRKRQKTGKGKQKQKKGDNT